MRRADERKEERRKEKRESRYRVLYVGTYELRGVCR